MRFIIMADEYDIRELINENDKDRGKGTVNSNYFNQNIVYPKFMD